MITKWHIENSVLVDKVDRMLARWVLYDLVIPLADQRKMWVEFGVHKGDTINYISRFAPIMFGFDSWEGLPDDWQPGFPKGHFSTNGTMPEVNPNVVLVKGMFQETLPKFLSIIPGTFGLVHIDSDIYESARFVLEQIEDRVTIGTVIIFDELIGYNTYEEHEYKALKEFGKRNMDRFDIKVMARTCYEQVAVIIGDFDCEEVEYQNKMITDLG
jgi:hypothetical protein